MADRLFIGTHFISFQAELGALMSYDIILFPAVAGQDPAVTAQCDAEIDDPLSDEGRARNTCIVAGLMAHTPSIEIHEFNEGVQISALDDGTCMQIELFNSEAAIRIPLLAQEKDALNFDASQFVSTNHCT